MTIRTVILDDDIHSHKAAKAALAAFSQVQILGDFFTSQELLRFLQEDHADLLFLDIELNEEFGFAIAQQLRKSYPELMIVFLTGHSSYAVDGYDFQPVNFLTKPINQVKLAQTIAEVEHRMAKAGTQRPAKLMFHLQQGYQIIDIRQICYIERSDRKNFLYTPKESLRIAGYTMRELEEMLSPHGFFLCHQSFLINLYRVKSLQSPGRQLYEVVLKDCDQPIPVSRNYYDALRQGLISLGIPCV